MTNESSNKLKTTENSKVIAVEEIVEMDAEDNGVPLLDLQDLALKVDHLIKESKETADGRFCFTMLIENI